MRQETRIERYLNKKSSAKFLPLSIVTVNFHCDGNLAYIIRTAACFGVPIIHVIGSVPPRNILKSESGSTVDFVDIRQYSSPTKFLSYARETKLNLISAELTPEAKNLYDYQFDFEKMSALVLGNESTGIPTEVILNSEVVYIPMPGLGFCLNTSQTGTAIVAEYTRQFYQRF